MRKDRDWNEEHVTVLRRLFDAVLGRSSASKEEIESDIHWLGTVNKHLRDENNQPSKLVK